MDGTIRSKRLACLDPTPPSFTPNICFKPLLIKFKNFATLFFIKFPKNKKLNVKSPPTATLVNNTDKPARVPNIFVSASDVARTILPIIVRSLNKFLLKSFNPFILPSDFNLKNVNEALVNHPPANIRRKLVNLLNNPCANLDTLLTGVNSANCTFFSNSLSLPCLKPSSAIAASLLSF